MSSYPHNPREFNKWLVSEYLKYGSVEEVYRFNNFNVPISAANYHRVLDKWGIIKAAGPNSKLSEIINFLYRMVEEEVPLEKLYKKMPHTFQISAVTLYRILGYIKEGITRRMGTALVLHYEGEKDKIILGREVNVPRLGIGKPGLYTIPMTFSKKTDMREDAILRVLQHEVMSGLAVEKKITESIIPKRPKPFMYLDIADVRVEVFDVPIPKSFSFNNFFSYKLSDYKFLDISDIKKIENQKKHFRAGILDGIDGYKKYLSLKSKNLKFNPLQVRTNINYFLAENYSQTERV